MKLRFTLFRRGRSYYSQDRTTGQQSSLHTTDPDEARQSWPPRTRPTASPS